MFLELWVSMFLFIILLLCRILEEKKKYHEVFSVDLIMKIKLTTKRKKN